MDLTTLGVFALAELLLCLTPGPAVLYVVSQGLGRGPVASIFANLGIVTGNLVYFAISAMGLSAILIASYEVFFLIKWAGAAYLVWLGLSTFFGRSAALRARPAEGPPRSGRKILASGVFLQFANPKAVMFFAAFLPLFIDPARPILPQFAILAAVSVAIEFSVQLMYGLLAGQAARLAELPLFARWIDRIAGSFLIAAGVLMAAMKKA